MNRKKTPPLVRERPEVTGRDARTHLLARNKRATVPVRNIFVQRPQGEDPRHGPLSTFVRNGDLRGLRAYLIVVAASGAERDTDGWTTELDSLVWARLFDADQTTGGPTSARAAAWRTLSRLQRRGLIRRNRPEPGSRRIAVTLLREDGNGDPYDRPTGDTIEDRFLRLPTALWTRGLDEQLGLPALAMLLVLAKEKPWSTFPPDRMDEWYGISGDTAQRGLKQLLELDLVRRRDAYKKAPLSPSGVTLIYQYQLTGPMRVPKAGTRPEAAA